MNSLDFEEILKGFFTMKTRNNEIISEIEALESKINSLRIEKLLNIDDLENAKSIVRAITDDNEDLILFESEDVNLQEWWADLRSILYESKPTSPFSKREEKKEDSKIDELFDTIGASFKTVGGFMYEELGKLNAMDDDMLKSYILEKMAMKNV